MVINHILPLTVNPSAEVPAPTEAKKALTQRLDDIVRQWIYGTISNDLLNSIIDPDDSAADAWNRLQNFFLNNKSARALQFDAQFTNTKLEHFDGVKSYCAHLKSLADNLRNVGDKISDNRMTLQLLKGLSEDYKPFRTFIRYLNPLPSFDTLRSMLELEEHGNATDLSLESRTEAHITQSHLSSQNNAANSHSSSRSNNQRNGDNGQKTTKGKGGSGNHQRNGTPQRGPSASHQQKTQAGWMYPPPWAYWQQGSWALPPCPYPSQAPGPSPWSVTRPSQPAHHTGILGPCPPQAYYTSGPSSQGYMPTNIDQAMHTMTLYDPNYYMDTGATSHMTTSQGLTDGEQASEM